MTIDEQLREITLQLDRIERAAQPLRLLGMKRVEERLDVSRATVWTMVSDGRLPPGRVSRPGGSRKWLETEIDDAIKGMSVAS